MGCKLLIIIINCFRCNQSSLVCFNWTNCFGRRYQEKWYLTWHPQRLDFSNCVKNTAFLIHLDRGKGIFPSFSCAIFTANSPMFSRPFPPTLWWEPGNPMGTVVVIEYYLIFYQRIDLQLLVVMETKRVQEF